MSNLVTLKELALISNSDVIGSPDFCVQSVATLEDATNLDISFLVNPLYRNDALLTRAGCLIAAQSDYKYLSQNTKATGPLNFLISKNPYVTFAKISQFFNNKKKILYIYPTTILQLCYGSNSLSIRHPQYLIVLLPLAPLPSRL